MGQTQIGSIGRLRPCVYRKSFYALEVLPKYAKAGGLAWASDFAAKTKDEQNAIVWRMVAQAARANARRAGRPDPIFYEAAVKQLKGGGYGLDQSVPMVPLRKAWGGDGRTVENTRDEPPRTQDSWELRLAVEKIKTECAERGIEIVVEAPGPEQDPLAIMQAIMPQRKAS